MLGFFLGPGRLRQRQTYSASHVRGVGARRHFKAGFLTALLTANNDDGCAIGLRRDPTWLCTHRATGGTGHRKTNRFWLRHSTPLRYPNLRVRRIDVGNFLLVRLTGAGVGLVVTGVWTRLEIAGFRFVAPRVGRKRDNRLTWRRGKLSWRYPFTAPGALGFGPRGSISPRSS